MWKGAPLEKRYMREKYQRLMEIAGDVQNTLPGHDWEYYEPSVLKLDRNSIDNFNAIL